MKTILKWIIVILGAIVYLPHLLTFLLFRNTGGVKLVKI